MLSAQVLCPFLCASMAVAALPALSAPEPVECGSRPLVVPLHSSPFYGDWNGDGLRDLLVGQFQDGMVRIAVNQGSEEDPEFLSLGWLSADGQPIKLPYG